MSERLGASPTNDHNDYVRALEIIAEAVQPVNDELARLAARAAERITLETGVIAPALIVDAAEEITFEEGVLAARIVLRRAEEITYEKGVLGPKKVIEQAEKITLHEAIYHEGGRQVVEAAEELTHYAAPGEQAKYPDHRPFMDHGLWLAERPRRPHDLEIEDLKVGTRIVTYNDKLVDKVAYAKHEVILSEPYLLIKDCDNAELYVLARRVADHATDNIPFNSSQEVRQVALSKWGIVSGDNGLFSTTSYAEPFVPQPALNRQPSR